MNIPEIDLQEALDLQASGAALFLDIRDPGSFAQRHVTGAIHLDNGSVGTFLESTERETRLVVYCYHGHASLGATAYLLEQGFCRVESLLGGFTAWAAAGGTGEQGA